LAQIRKDFATLPIEVFEFQMIAIYFWYNIRKWLRIFEEEKMEKKRI